MIANKILTIASISVFLSACGGGGSTSVGISHTSSSVTSVSSYDEPALLKASVYDSFGDRTTIDSNVSAEIDPYYDNGLFEINWSVDAPRDYYLEVSFGYSLFIDNASIVHSEYCGPQESCDYDGFTICEYTTDLAMRCDSRLGFADISPQIFSLPQSGYLFISACSVDLAYCEYDTIRTRLF